MTESEEELKSLWMKVKEESEKADLKLNNQKTKIMASCLVPSWQIDRETMKTLTLLFSWGPKSLQMLTVAMKLSLLLLVKSYDKLRQHIKKQRHYFAAKCQPSLNYGFSSSRVCM